MAKCKSLAQRARRGVAAVEFALTISLWTTMLLGAVDGCYYLIVNERCDRIAYTVTDIVTQYQAVTKAELSDIFLGAAQLMSPISFSGGTVIVTSVYQAAGQGPTICWQYNGSLVGAGINVGSKVGTPNNSGSNCANGSPATLPNGLTLNTNDNVIISEVYYTFNPIFLGQDSFLSTKLYRVAVYKPRLSPLTTPPT